MILRMKRITLIAHKADEKKILKALQAIDAVELINSGEERADIGELTKAQDKVQRLSSALTVIKPYSPKTGMLTPLPEESLGTIVGELSDALSVGDAVENDARELARLNSEIEKNDGVIASLRPWLGFPADMQRFNTAKSVQYFPGILAAADLPRLDEIADSAEYQCFSEDIMRAVVVACRRDEAKSVSSFLKTLDWTDASFPKIDGTPREASDSLEAQNTALKQRCEELKKQLAEQAEKNALLLGGGYDAAVIDRDRAQAASEVVRTAATFRLEGWTPEEKLDAVEKAVQQVTDAFSLEVRDPEEGETPPSVVRNTKFSTPFEAVTNLYSRPDPNGIDATPYMAPFYVLLFGMMLSDTGYGILLSLACLLYLKLKKPTGAMTNGILRVLFWGGISTIVWGVLVGSFFGLDFDQILGTKDMFPLLIDPMSDPISMLILCFGLGLIHILFGMILKMKMSFQRGDWQTAIFDNLSWMFIIFGLIGLVWPPTKIPGIILALLGALMILLFKGRGTKNPFKRTISGLGELYQVTSFLSDVLSYARLFALGIATGVIASVFNDLCSMLMGSSNIFLNILGTIVACALLVALHLFNLAINTLGTFVHCARLQYVEFYGKFYEFGGREFRPLGYKTKHVRLTDKAS